jgi:hypothetical protein
MTSHQAKIYMMLSAIFAILLGARAQAQADVEFYQFFVGPQGSATALGTRADPLTLEGARDRIRTIRAEASNDVPRSFEVILLEGTYSRSSPFVLSPIDSGDPEWPIVYRADTNMEGPVGVLISGGVRVSTWNQGGISGPVNNTFRWWGTSQVSWDARDAYFNNHRLIRSREPDIGETASGYWPVEYSRGNANATRDYRVSGLLPDFPPNTPPSTFGYVEMVARYAWIAPRGRPSQVSLFQSGSLTKSVAEFLDTSDLFGIVSSDHLFVRGQTHVEAGGDCAPQPGTNSFVPAEAFFEGRQEYIDKVYEWWQRPAYPGNYQLNVVLPDDLNNPSLPTCQVDPRSSGSRFIVPIAEKLLVLEGASASNQVKHIQFENINFAYCRTVLPDAAYRPALRTCRRSQCFVEINDNFIPGAVELIWASNCVIQGCRIAHTGGTGLIVFGSDNTIRGNEIFDVGACGIHVGPIGQYYNGSATVAANHRSQRVAIEHNYIHDYGMVYHDAPGINSTITDDLRLINNHVAHGGYAGIAAGMNNSSTAVNRDKGMVITGNRIHDVMKIIADGGGIFVRGDVTGAELGLSCPAGDRLAEVRNNYIYNIPVEHAFGPSAALFFDNQSRTWTVKNNVIESASRALYLQSSIHINPADWADPESFCWGTGADVNFRDSASPIPPSPMVQPPAGAWVVGTTGATAAAVKAASGPDPASYLYLYEFDPLVHSFRGSGECP